VGVEEVVRGQRTLGMRLKELEGDGAEHRTRPQTSEGLHPGGGHRSQDKARAHGTGELAETLGGAMCCHLAAELRDIDLDPPAPGAIGLDAMRSLHGVLPSAPF
jgi:hypothetical protein